jgi:diguanylate cyclase (GGDEF)-like protein
MIKTNEFAQYYIPFIQEYDTLAPQKVFKALFTGWLLYISFSLLDVFMAPESLFLFLTIRFAIVTPIVWTLYYFSQAKIAQKYIQLYLFITTILAGCGILAMIFLSKPTEPSFHTYYAGIFLVILWIYALCPMRFMYAATATWAIILIYNLLIAFHQIFVDSFSEAFTLNMFFNNNFFIVSAAIIGMVAGKTIENCKLLEYIQRKKLSKANIELEKRAHYDTLTTLPNRVLFLEKSQALINLNKRDHKTSYILYLDLDGFKIINDTFGHAMGDSILQQAAKIFKESIRDTDIPCRMGGDEFLILLTHCTSEKSAEIVSKRIIYAMQQQAVINKQDQVFPFPTISIGICQVNSKISIENNISIADKALYQAKNAGKNQFCFYIP